jgi:signal transduction histidine kinase
MIVSVETLARPRVVDAGAAIEIHALTRDVTPLVEHSAQLERATDLLSQANQTLGRFAADAAHDLRAPLQAITGFAQLLARREGANLDSTSQRFVAMIMGAANDMANLINSALEYGQAMGADSPLAPVDCSTIVAEALLRLDTELVDTGATVHFGDLPTVHGEPNQLSRVFQNLIANACKAALPGRPARVVVSAARVAGAWELSVTDDGAGVLPEDRERIFHLFKRGSNAAEDGGAGIGLAICRTIVERHGGRIWVEDPEGGGSRFSFLIPDLEHGPDRSEWARGTFAAGRC